MMHSLLILIDTVLNLYVWCLIIAVAMSWLIQFNIINTQNRIVYVIYDFFVRITEPLLSRIRRFIPSFGGIDVTPVIAILLIWFIRLLLREYGGLIV
jgi:YggT family protein